MMTDLVPDTPQHIDDEQDDSIPQGINTQLDTITKTDTGAPPITGDEEQEYKKLYLRLLEEGNTSRSIEKLREKGLDIPEASIRCKWGRDDEFNQLCQRARALATYNSVENIGHELRDCMALAKAGEASSQYVTLMGTYIKHEHWLASKHNPDVYGEKIRTDNRHQIAQLIIDHKMDE